MTTRPALSELPGWRAGLPAALIGWAWARICVGAGFLLAHRTIDFLDNPDGAVSLARGLFVWDGSYYRVLAQHWYDGANPDAARFFPLYPQLARMLAPLFGGNVEISLLVISNLAALVGALLCWRLTLEALARRDTVADPGSVPAPSDAAEMTGGGTGDRRGAGDRHSGDDRRAATFGGWLQLRRLLHDDWAGGVNEAEALAIANRTAWMVAVFPAGFVLAFAYTESLALALTAGTLLALVRRHFVTAGVLALFAAMLRPVGGLLLVPIVIELWQSRPRPTWLRSTVALAGPVVGITIAFLWINASTHDLLLPWRLQQEIRGGFQDPVTRVLEPIGEAFKGNFRDSYNLGFMAVFIFLGFQAVRFRQRLSWLTFAFVSSLILLSSQVTDSLGRYGLVVVPFIVAAAQWADTRAKQRLYAGASSLLLVWLVSEALISRLVP